MKGLNAILTYAVDSNGVPIAELVTTISNGLKPFGFDFNGSLIIVEAFGTGAAVPAENADVVDSLTLISGSMGNGQTSACWLVSRKVLP